MSLNITYARSVRAGGLPLKPITEFIVHVTELIEAEGRALRQVAAKFGLGMSLTIVASALLLLGFFGLLAGLWLGLDQHLSRAGASALTGVISLGLAGGVLWVAGRLTK